MNNIRCMEHKILIFKRYLLLITAIMIASCSDVLKPKTVIDASSDQVHAKQIKAVKVHLVQPGETLFSIARQNKVSWQHLATINNIAEPHIIYPGQTLYLDKNSNNYQAKSQAKSSSQDVAKKSNTNTKKTGSNKTDSNSVNSSSSANKNVEFKTSFKSNTNCDGKWVWPAQGTLIGNYSSNSIANKGIDIAGTLGSKVVAAADGMIAYIGTGITGYGQSVVIKHNEVCVSIYAHNRTILVQERTMVKAGQIIAEMGNTDTDRVKLHFEIRDKEKPVNPIVYLPKK